MNITGMQFKSQSLYSQTPTEDSEIVCGNCTSKRGREAMANSNIRGSRALIMVKKVIEMAKVMSVNPLSFTG